MDQRCHTFIDEIKDNLTDIIKVFIGYSSTGKDDVVTFVEDV